jgi:hypothetical protein
MDEYNYSKEYAFTFKDNRVDSIQYDEIFDRFRENHCKITDMAGELDSHGKLHYHGIVEIPAKVYRKSLCPRGFHMVLKEIHDKDGWEAYYKKDQKEPVSPDTNDNELMERLSEPLFRA